MVADSLALPPTPTFPLDKLFREEGRGQGEGRSCQDSSTIIVMMNNSSQKGTRRALRRRMTTAERTLWSQLRSRTLAGYKFKRQVSIDQYVVDFYCAQKKLILEIDGTVHGFSQQRQHDQQRQRDLESHGFTVLRFTNSQIKNSIGTALNSILERLEHG